METEGVPCGNDKLGCSTAKLELVRTLIGVQLIAFMGVSDRDYRRRECGIRQKERKK